MNHLMHSQSNLIGKKTYKLKIHNNLPKTFFIINCKGTNKKYPLEIHTDYSA